MTRRLCGFILMAMSLLALTSAAWGHPPASTAALINIADDGRIVITVVHDSLAFALDDTSTNISDRDMFGLLDAPESRQAEAFADGLDRFKHGFHLQVDRSELPFEVTQSPSVAGVRQWKSEHSGRTLPCKMDFVVEAKLPADASVMTLQFPEILADTLIVVHRPGFEHYTLPLPPGEQSPNIDVRMSHRDGSAAVAPDHAGQPGALDVAWRFIKLGFTHIIPRGLDHCLFVLGLFLLSPRIKPVLWQISSFTIAHTITLTLTSLGIIGLSSRIVEPTIAATIAFVAVENLLTKKVHSWRIIVAFIFGLVHGMGVATAFHEAGFPPGQLVTSLAAFTVGVEAGHIAVLIAAFAALAWSRNKPWYRTRIAIPISLLIALIALLWIVQRLMPPG